MKINDVDLYFLIWKYIKKKTIFVKIYSPIPLLFKKQSLLSLYRKKI